MQTDQKLWACGLPRSGGQSLQVALSILFPDRVVYHSPGNNWHRMTEHDNLLGAVEVFAPYQWLEETYLNPIYIYNYRDLDSWLASCESVYARSQREHWNHPLWRYPLEQFEDYFHERCDEWRRWSDRHSDRCFEIDIISNPDWVELCTALAIPHPQCAFPRADRMKPRPAAVCSQPTTLLRDFTCD